MSVLSEGYTGICSKAGAVIGQEEVPLLALAANTRSTVRGIRS
jgi:hypothetical protein